MVEALLISQILMWIALVVLGILGVAIARQVGVLHQRIAPMGALMVEHGPAVKSLAPQIPALTLAGAPCVVGAPNPNGRPTLMMFVGCDCAVCKQLIPVIKSFARRESLQILFIGDDTSARLAALVATHGLEQFSFVNSSNVGRIYHVDKIPYAVLLAGDGHIAAKGLVNTREHLESLVGAHETAFGTIQDLLKSNTG